MTDNLFHKTFLSNLAIKYIIYGICPHHILSFYKYYIMIQKRISPIHSRTTTFISTAITNNSIAIAIAI